MQKVSSALYNLWLKENLISTCAGYSTSSTSRKKVCIIGSGPAGFYTAEHLLKSNVVEVDIYEKLPVPFGLIRYGVAPDHPEIKVVANSFTKTALKEHCSFFGNVDIGKDVTVPELLKAYHGVVLAYGADKDKSFGIPGENARNVMSAKQFVGWYNGHPDHVNEKISLDTEVAIVIGHGNVALDVARILLRSLEDLKSTDITDYAFEALTKSRIKKLILVGRRGPLQVSFTIKELREMIKLPSCNPYMELKDFEGISNLIPSLPRPRKRLIELLYNTAVNMKNDGNKKLWELKFFRSPKSILCDGNGRVEKVVFGINKIEGNSETSKIISTDEEDIMNCGLVIKSVGYQSSPVDSFVPFDEAKHIIPNTDGKVHGKEGLYCSGWVKTGPVGVILSTMSGSFQTAEKLLEDLEKSELSSKACGGKEIILNLLRSRGIRYTTFSDWQIIDKTEQEQGKCCGKSRQKIVNIEEMLKIAAAS